MHSKKCLNLSKEDCKMNKKNKRKFVTHDKNAVFFKSIVLDVIEKEKETANGTFKTLFKVQHPTKNEPLTCVLWERSSMDIGDKIDIKGIFKDNIFIAYSAMVHKNYGNI